MAKNFTIIVATDNHGGIGCNGAIPWNVPEDMKMFKETTTNNIVIMGRKTYDSIGKPLPNRTNVVITRQPLLGVSIHEEFALRASSTTRLIFVTSLAAALALVNDDQKAFIIGGGEIYNQTIDYCDTMIVTTINHQYECDTFWRPDLNKWREESSASFHSEKANVDFTVTKMIRQPAHST